MMEKKSVKPDVENVVSMFGLRIVACDLEAATEMIILAAKEKRKELVVTPNIDHIVTIKKNSAVEKIYQDARLVFADGMPLVWLSYFLPGVRLPKRVTGADLLVAVCDKCGTERLTIGIIGGAPNVAEKASSIIEQRYPGIRVAGTYCPPLGFEFDTVESEKIVAISKEWHADIICLALGTPKQELWAKKYIDGFNCGPILCFGAAIDFIVGTTYKRAPVFFRDNGFEWLWRLYQEPVRMFQRYFLRDSIFFWYAACEIAVKWLDYFREDSEKFNK